MKKKQLVIRIVAIVMAALMLLGVVSLIFNVAFAADSAAVATGSQDLPKWPIIALAAAGIVVVACVIVPKIKRK